eukprot:CAMPEP_0194373748 /NCGR_PEP_ID=MMETSP0174-20130528/22203_1 /TAXON_ID=216777 /ORGANISM="Proboscia alata, Strain PI-D3" /LENGTH=464 /DNA_ID=CAMNT_0039153003 /DNA_START=142 /DNA_END=1536 /DNA_ORIENTATION=-
MWIHRQLWLCCRCAVSIFLYLPTGLSFHGTHTLGRSTIRSFAFDVSNGKRKSHNRVQPSQRFRNLFLSNKDSEAENITIQLNATELAADRTPVPVLTPSNTETPSTPDRAINIVSELKATAALFAAFAYGSLNLPPTLTVSESKVTTVTTSLSITRPIPESILLQSFVVLDAFTLCLMISCVVASQLLIYRLSDGSYELPFSDANVNVGLPPQNQNRPPATPTSYKNKKRNSALGRLTTHPYRAEFTVARITFDLGLLSLLLAVAVRVIAIFDVTISLPVVVTIGVTVLGIGAAYILSYFDVFRPLPKNSTPGDVDTANAGFWTIVWRFLLTAGLCYPLIIDVANLNEVLPNELESYSRVASDSKLKLVTQKLANERADNVENQRRPKKDKRGANESDNRDKPRRNQRDKGVEKDDRVDLEKNKKRESDKGAALASDIDEDKADDIKKGRKEENQIMNIQRDKN